MSEAPPVVPDNRWDLLDPPDPGPWDPDVDVSLVVPCRDGHDALARTLATVAAQRYPAHRLEVIVADDGSNPPLAPAEPEPFPLRVVEVDPPPAGTRRFGAGAARNAGAAAAEGDVVLFCDADILLDPSHVAAHARWHAVSGDAVTMAPLRFVETDASPAALTEAARAGRLAQLLEARGASEHTWIVRHVERSEGLTRTRPDLFRVVVAANLGVGRALLDEVGGFTAFGVRGIEDTEIGYRLWSAGGLLVRDPTARAWHQGARTLTGPERERALAERAPLQAAWLPEGGFREDGIGGHPRPRTVVEIGPGGPADVAACVRAVLASTDGDLAICVPDPADADLDDDPRVEPGSTAAEAHPWSPLRWDVPAGARPTPAALSSLRCRLDEHGLGALHALLPRTGELAHLRRARAMRRAARGAGTRASGLARPEDLDPIVGELFGERWVAGEDVGVVPEGVAPREEPVRVHRSRRELAVAGARAIGRIRRPHDVRKIVIAARRALGQ
ncbi:glycosyltransferase [Egibacter rhizosphaerae]|nr:glycosyltransferase family 2 protein [Egibacter rhizosphaerae]